MTLAETVEERAHDLGFDLVGIAPAGTATTASRYQAWLDLGYHGEMAYLARPDAAAKRGDPSLTMPQAGTLITVAMNYHTSPLPPDLRDDPSRGIIASYAWGADYHDVMTTRLRQLADDIETALGTGIEWRAYVDTGPLLERELAARAGLGFIGKNTNLIHRHLGSWLFLGELLVTAELPPVAPTNRATDGRNSAAQATDDTRLQTSQDLAPLLRHGTCGRCTRCLDACPTNAFVAPYILDARRCISYLTIELKGAIPRELRPLMGNRIFGCDICQEVCPWNRRFAWPSTESAFQPLDDSIAPRLLDLIGLDEEGFRRRFRRSPLWRTKRRGLLRNVAVALGNWGEPAALPALVVCLEDPEALIRGHAAWALGRFPSDDALDAVQRALSTEEDWWVREELHLALAEC